MNSRCLKLANGNNNKKKKNRKIKAKQRAETSRETIGNQIISTRREKMLKCENKQRQEKNHIMR